jgi:hypothetical protein
MFNRNYQFRQALPPTTLNFTPINDSFQNFAPFHNNLHPTTKMTDSGGFIKVPSSQEEEQMQKAADNSKAKREAAKKEREAREAEELMTKAAESSKNRRKKD